MDALSQLMQGFATAATPMNLVFAFAGVLLGTAIGVLPGIGPAMTVALLLPMTFGLDPTGSLIMFAGIYYGAMYGGSTTAILINAPGEASSVMTAIEGNLMARSGRAAQALATAAIGSFVAGTIATTLLVFTAPYIADLAIGIRPADYFALMVLAFCAVTVMLGKSKVRGAAGLGIGLALGLIGLDPVTGQERMTYGVLELANGLDIVIIAVGLFAVGETLWVAAHLRRRPLDIIPVGRPWMSRDDWKRSWPAWIRGAFIGFPFGAIPAGGAELPTYLSYATEKKLAKKPNNFGKGAIEGVAGPDSANNAAAAGVLVPLLTLGLPTSATAAVLLAGFQQFGIQPGPLLLDSEPELVWGLLASLFIANVLLVVLNLPLAPLWARLLRIPRHFLYAGILVFATLGVFSAGETFGLYILLLLGLLGFAMRRFGIPLAPAIIGVILGPLAETQLRRALQLGNGDLSVLITTPMSISIYTILILILLATTLGGPIASRIRQHRKTGQSPAPDAAVAMETETPARTEDKAALEQIRQPR
jgi:putative tricarboxylic transport membrane protein